MQTLAVYRELFMMAFGRDVDYHDSLPQGTWLDRSTGEVLWFYECDEDAYMEAGMPADENHEECEGVEAAPECYLEISGLDHGEHHGILREFLRSAWSSEEARRLRAETAYSGSIGGWNEGRGRCGALRAFREYREAQITAMSEEFLRENGIFPDWKRKSRKPAHRPACNAPLHGLHFGREYRFYGSGAAMRTSRPGAHESKGHENLTSAPFTASLKCFPALNLTILRALMGDFIYTWMRRWSETCESDVG